MRTAVQLFTLRGVAATLPELIELVAETPLEGVELAGIGDADPAAIADALDAADLDAAGAHVDARTIEDELEAVVGTYRTIGCDTVVVPYLEGACFADGEAVDRTAARLSELASRLDEHGVRLLYHNHDHEFGSLDGETAFERLVERSSPAVGFELDVGWAAAAGQDPVDLLGRLGERAPLVHLKDVDLAANEPVELGEGDVDVAGCAAAARRVDAEWLVYEHDDPADPVASLRGGARRLRELV